MTVFKLQEAPKDTTTVTLYLNKPMERNDAVNVLKYYDIDPQWVTNTIYVPYNNGALIYTGKMARIVLDLDEHKKPYIKAIALVSANKDFSTRTLSDADRIFTLEEFKELISKQREIEYKLHDKKLVRDEDDPIERSYETQRAIDNYNNKISPRAYASAYSDKVPESYIEQVLIEIAEKIKENLKNKLVAAGIEYKKNHKDATKEELFNFFSKTENKLLDMAGIPIHPDLFLKTFREHDALTDDSMYLENLIGKYLGDKVKYIPRKGKDGQTTHTIRRPLSGYTDVTGKKMDDLLDKYKNAIETKGNKDNA